MAFFSYKIEHDLGLAPNPFGGYCTLAVCKPGIRNNRRLSYGDWVIGTGSVKLGNLHHLIYMMKVEEKMSLEEYWDDPRFFYKRPGINGSLTQMYGDNIYHRDSKTNDWIQEDSAHSFEGGTTNLRHLEVDTGGKFVLISQRFFYFGDKAIRIPDRFRAVCSEGRSVKGPSIPDSTAHGFVQWVEAQYPNGIHGDPVGWKIHDQPYNAQLSIDILI